MTTPRALRKQFQEYAAAGFTVRRAQPRKGSHWKVWFNEFPEPVFITVNAGDVHAIANNVARFRRLAKGLIDSSGSCG